MYGAKVSHKTPELRAKQFDQILNTTGLDFDASKFWRNPAVRKTDQRPGAASGGGGGVGMAR